MREYATNVMETGIIPAVGIFETTSGRTGKRVSGNRIIFKREAASRLEAASLLISNLWNKNSSVLTAIGEDVHAINISGTG